MTTFDEEKFKEKIIPIMTIPIVYSFIGHSKRKDFLYISNENTGMPLLYHWISESERKQLSTKPTAGIKALHATKSLVAQTKDVGGSENYAVYLYDFVEKNSKQLTKEPIGSIADIYWIDDEHLLVVGFNDENYYVRTLDFNGHIVDVFTTKEQVLNTHYDHERGLLAAAIGRRFTKIAIIDIKEAKVKEWISEGEKIGCSFPAFSSDGQLAYTSDKQISYDEIIIQVNGKQNEQKRFLVPGYIGFWPFDEAAIQWIGEDKLSVFVGKDGRVSLYLLDITLGDWHEILPKDLSLGDAIVTSDGIVWKGSSFKRPQTIQKFKDNKNSKLFDMGSQDLEISIENHWFESYDGQKIQGWLVKNPDPQAPLLLYCHGGPTYAITNSWNVLLLPFVLAGFNLFVPNFRGSTTFGTEFKDLNIEQIGKGDLKDVLYGAKYIKEFLNYDPKPLIYGASHGGYLTLQALTTQPDDWLGGVSWVPMADLLEAYELANSHYKVFLRHFLGGSPEEKLELYKECSPITHVANLKVPLFIYHGANDSRCPVSSVKRFYKEAKKRNLPVELVIAGDEGHGSMEVQGILDVIKLSVKHLQSLL
ncbi:MAG: alpha/beta hydrolase family protein [Candidatus Heimdallarchaeota archaeon]